MNGLYPSARSAFLAGLIDWSDAGDDYVVALLGDGYTYDAAHDFASDLADVIDDAPVVGRTILVDGVADADDVTTMTVPEGQTVKGIAIYRDTGTPSTSRLIYFADENDDGSPIDRAGDGSAVPVLWSSSADRVFRL